MDVGFTVELAKEWACGSGSNGYANRYEMDLTGYDIVIGYRADDSYFSFAQDFVTGAIPLSKLQNAMCLGELGEQIWFVGKDDAEVYVYSLADFTAENGVRDTSDIIEKYRKGAFAALPDPELINTLLSIKGNSKGEEVDGK